MYEQHILNEVERMLGAGEPQLVAALRTFSLGRLPPGEGGAFLGLADQAGPERTETTPIGTAGRKARWWRRPGPR